MIMMTEDKNWMAEMKFTQHAIIIYYRFTLKNSHRQQPRSDATNELVLILERCLEPTTLSLSSVSEDA